jgi:hypothetical protein
MSYLSNTPGRYGSLGAVDPTHWKTVSGIAKPMDFGTLGIFKDLQTQVNRLAVKFKTGGVSVDGAIGPGTLAKVKDIANHVFYAPGMRASSVDDVAGIADEIAANFRAAADNSGIPATVPAPRPAPSMPSVSLPGPMMVPTAPSSPAFLAPLAPLASGFPGGMTGLMVGAGALLLLVAQKKGWLKRKGKGARAMARARRRR